MTAPASDYEAFVLALKLAVTAPTEKQAIDATSIAVRLAAHLTLEERGQACDEVEALVNAETNSVRRMVNRRIGRR